MAKCSCWYQIQKYQVSHPLKMRVVSPNDDSNHAGQKGRFSDLRAQTQNTENNHRVSI